jgi:predicted ATPase
LLLVLDNCERLVADIGALAAAIATRAAGVKILVTSQELLNVAGEQLYRLGPLAVPPPDEAPVASRHGAVGLFVERARAVDPRFELTAHNAAAVAELCRRLDGLPLAIELAAARVRLLGVQGVLDRLGERFRVLAGGARTALPRHQALHATLDWSHALLSPLEQTVLRRLGVFVGGFALPLAQQVPGDGLDEWAVLDALGGLVDKSLVAVDSGEPPRYRLLETTRAYALEKLHEQGETEATLRRHAQAVAAFLLDADEARFGEGGTLSMADYLERTAAELDNLRAALDWALDTPGERPLAITLAAAGAEVFRQLGLSQEALRRMGLLWPLADDAAPAATIALFCTRYGSLGNNGRLPHTVIRVAEARAERIYRQRGDRRRLHFGLYFKSWSLNLFGESEAAAAVLAEMQAIEQPHWPVWLRASRLNVQATVLLFEERFDAALEVALEQQRLLAAAPGEESLLTTCQSNLCNILNCLQRFDEAIAVARAVIGRNAVRRDRNIDYATAHLMAAQLFLGRLDDATETMRQSLAGWRRDVLLRYVCFGLALLLAMRGRFDDAARLEGAGLAFYRRTGVKLAPVAQRVRARLHELYLPALGDAAVASLQLEGELLDDAAIEALCRREAAAP